MRADFRSRRESLLAVDEAIADVVGTLARTGRLASTYVLFTSDNGFFQGEHRIVKGKYLAYDPSTRVPLLIRGPGIAPGTVSKELVANTDLAPTLLEATGAVADIPVDGRSILPFARDPRLRTRRAVLHEGLVPGDIDRDGAPRTHRVPRYRAIRTGQLPVGRVAGRRARALRPGARSRPDALPAPRPALPAPAQLAAP